MINANELRLNNWVAMPSSGAYVQITAMDISDIQSNLKNRLRIPLTEDWLLKFGFEYNSEDELYVLRKFIESESGVVEFTMTDYETEWVFAKMHDAYRSIEWVNLAHIKYVHQLQNLYFAITHTELELKK